VRAVLKGKTPAQRAHELITGTRLADPASRKSLLEGGTAAVSVSSDPLIVMAREIDPMDRELRRELEAQVESVEVAAGEKIGRARFAAYGKSAYPDATFTLRLTYGTVGGYPMNGGAAPAFTTLLRPPSRDGPLPPQDLRRRPARGRAGEADRPARQTVASLAGSLQRFRMVGRAS
jgi:hypothetical protein